MAYIQGSAIEKASKGSIEKMLDGIHEAINDKYSDSLNIVATFEGYVLAFNADKKLRKISFTENDDGSIGVIDDRSSKAIPVIEECDVSAHVAKELRRIAVKLMEGKGVPRTQVRELSSFVDKEEFYWMSDILSMAEESMGDNDWYKMYNANVERIRTSLHGRIRDIEGRVPKIHYSKIARGRISEFKNEMSESMGIVGKVFNDLVDDCRRMSFDEKQEFLGVVRESLIVEARTIGGLLGKAEKLLGHSDLSLVAKVHDKLADRARTMALVSEYLSAKVQHSDKE